MFVHQELHTPDTDSARAFYGSVFDWTFQEMPMPDGVYLGVATADGTGIGGISAAKVGQPTMWLGYVGVASVDHTTKKVTNGGGKVVLDKQEVPNMGWFAWYEDPNGAVFGVWEPKAAAPPPANKKAAKKKKKAAAKKKKVAAKQKKKAGKKDKAAKKKAAKKDKAAKKKAGKKKAGKKKAGKKKARK